MIAVFLASLFLEGATASLRFEPEQAVLGEPVELVLEVTHAPETPFAWGSVLPEPDPSWVVLGTRRELSEVDEEGRTIARRVWSIASLEPGPRRAPEAFRIALEEAGVTVLGLEPLLDVTGVLAEGEDEPRPLRDFPDSLAFEDAGDSFVWWPWAAAGSMSVFLLLLLRRRKPAEGAAAEPPLSELARLMEATDQGPQELHFALSRLVRKATDARLGRKRQGLTDEEWLTVTKADAGLSSEVQADMVRLFEKVAAVKYAGEVPSSWAVDETFKEAERVLQLVEKAPGSTLGEGA